MKYTDALTNLKYGHAIVPAEWMGDREATAIVLDGKSLYMEGIVVPCISIEPQQLFGLCKSAVFQRKTKSSPWAWAGGVSRVRVEDIRANQEWYSIAKQMYNAGYLGNKAKKEEAFSFKDLIEVPAAVGEPGYINQIQIALPNNNRPRAVAPPPPQPIYLPNGADFWAPLPNDNG